MNTETLTDACEAIMATIPMPEGASYTLEIEEGEDDAPETVIVRLRAEHRIDDGAWIDMEEAVDLTAAGCAFEDGGAMGGPWHEGGRTYTGGTYQRWAVVGAA